AHPNTFPQRDTLGDADQRTRIVPLGAVVLW
ncbi:MAG: hypothetical protein RLZZ495_1366, partial [Pseudomonadota bacterium]